MKRPYQSVLTERLERHLQAPDTPDQIRDDIQDELVIRATKTKQPRKRLAVALVWGVPMVSKR